VLVCGNDVEDGVDEDGNGAGGGRAALTCAGRESNGAAVASMDRTVGVLIGVLDTIRGNVGDAGGTGVFKPLQLPKTPHSINVKRMNLTRLMQRMKGFYHKI
jgi:hypothetical protein